VLLRPAAQAPTEQRAESDDDEAPFIAMQRMFNTFR